MVRALGKWNPRFISSLNKAKETPLHWAAAKGKTPMVKLLLEMGAWRLCDSQSDEGWTPLHHAAANGHFQTVEVLVQRGTKMNTQNNKGNTPLHIASSNGQAGIVDFLVKKGARSDIKNNEGRTAAGSGKSAAVNSIMAARPPMMTVVPKSGSKKTSTISGSGIIIARRMTRRSPM